jgi:hypothetical protein
MALACTSIQRARELPSTHADTRRSRRSCAAIAVGTSAEESSTAMTEPRVRRHLLHVLALVASLCACAMNPERLPELDRRFYYNLGSEENQKEFLELRDEDRQRYLEDKGLWKQWMALPENERNAVGRSEVEVGFHEFSAFMAWGPPADTQTRDPDGKSVRVHTFIRCTSGPKAGRYVRSNLDCDGTSSEIQVAVSEGVITEIEHPH